MGLTVDITDKVLSLTLTGDFINFDDEAAKNALLSRISRKNISRIIVKGKSIGKWDSTLVVILFKLMQNAARHNIRVDIDSIPSGLQRLLRLALTVQRHPEKTRAFTLTFLEALGQRGLTVYTAMLRGISFIYETLKSVGRFILKHAVFRPVDFLFVLEDCSYRAVPIVSLISFMVGLILAFVGAVQLKLFGAQIYVASLVTIGMTRIMGAIMIGIIMAGRTGASYAATIGTMQVNEEIDALKTMGILPHDFLVLPRFLALVLTMPFLTMWADFMGIIGGGTVSILMLDIAPQEYIKYTMNAFNLTNFLVGIFHGLVFGCVIALCGCYYGIRCGRNADSVGVATTKAVVSAIVWMIIMTGIITFICEVMDI